MKKDAALLILLFILFVFFAAFLSNNKLEHQRLTHDFISINGELIQVEIADDQSERVQGLSGRNELKIGVGLLFIFDILDMHGIWMKDMNFPIDIIWFDENKKIVSIEKNVEPSTYPNVFIPSQNALYVLELNAGDVELYGIEIGQGFVFEN